MGATSNLGIDWKIYGFFDNQKWVDTGPARESLNTFRSDVASLHHVF